LFANYSLQILVHIAPPVGSKARNSNAKQFAVVQASQAESEAQRFDLPHGFLRFAG
jgi:hypothetical protein